MHMIKPCEGKNVWIHDCTVWNQDDCIAVKVLLLMLKNYQKRKSKGPFQDGSENMLFERITASGVSVHLELLFFFGKLSKPWTNSSYQIGLTIGSIGSSVVNNITFRCHFNCFLGAFVKLVCMLQNHCSSNQGLLYAPHIQGNLHQVSWR